MPANEDLIADRINPWWLLTQWTFFGVAGIVGSDIHFLVNESMDSRRRRHHRRLWDGWMSDSWWMVAVVVVVVVDELWSFLLFFGWYWRRLNALQLKMGCALIRLFVCAYEMCLGHPISIISNEMFNMHDYNNGLGYTRTNTHSPICGFRSGGSSGMPLNDFCLTSLCCARIIHIFGDLNHIFVDVMVFRYWKTCRLWLEEKKGIPPQGDGRTSMISLRKSFDLT